MRNAALAIIAVGVVASCTGTEDGRSSEENSEAGTDTGAQAGAHAGKGTGASAGRGSGGSNMSGGDGPGTSNAGNGAGGAPEGGEGGAGAAAGSGAGLGGSGTGGGSSGGSDPGSEGGEGGEGGAACDELCPSGVCTIKLAGTDDCLEGVLQGPPPGGAITASTGACESDYFVDAAQPFWQVWEVTLEASGAYRLKNAGTDFCLSGVTTSPPGYQVSVSTALCEDDGIINIGGEHSQLWDAICVGPNRYRLSLAGLNECLGGYLWMPPEAIAISAATTDCEDDLHAYSGINESRQIWEFAAATP